MDTSKTDWLHGIWFVPGETCDFLGTMFHAEGKWIFDFRFRYYSPDSTNPHDGKDRKSRYSFATKDDSEAEKNRMLHTIGQVILANEQHFNAKSDFVALDCAPEDPKFLFELGSRDWAHIKLEPCESTEPKQGA